MKGLMLVIALLPHIARGSFFEERYRGWLWFEENKKKMERKIITPKDAKENIENMKEELEGKRNVMIVDPTPENVIEYLVLEEKMWERALELDNAYRTARFRYPEFFDKVKNPTNVGAVRLKRKQDKDRMTESIEKFATKHDLVFFSKGNCEFCKEFAPILKSFGDKYGFNIEEASILGEVSGLFSGGNYPNLAKKLDIKVTPSIYVISKNKKQAFELIRGYVSNTELEEYAYIASNYVTM